MTERSAIDMKHKTLKVAAGTIAALHAFNTFLDSSIFYTTGTSNGKHFLWSQGTVFYRVLGRGEPILLLHDLNLFSSWHEWKEIISKLAETHTVYALDLLGCGESDKPNITYTSYLYVQLITAFVQQVIQVPPVVVTSGFSATFVVMAEALSPDLFSSIQMINPPSMQALCTMPDWHSRLCSRIYRIPVLSRTLYYRIVSKNNTEDYLTEECYYNPFELKQSVVRAGYEAAHRDHGKGRFLYASIRGNYLNTDISSVIEKTGKKLTILLGDHADAADLTEEYQSMNAAIKIEIIKNTKKLPQLEQPEKVASLILAACQKED